jgi:prepilin-type N-terminal cleavage/methylation domain-containing protein
VSEPRGRRGFTLLEVLVAVALLGIVVSVLARSAIEGMSYEGDATRRMRASLIADRVLWGVEAGLKLAPPQPTHEETVENEEFRVTLDVQPIDLGPGGLDALLPAPAPASAAARGAPEAPKAPATPLPLFRIGVRVAWDEGLLEQEVTRSSFAYDGAAAAQALGAAEQGEAAAPPAEQPAEKAAPEPEEAE